MPDTIRAEYLNIRDACYAPPRFYNTDGDPLLFHTLTFRIGSTAAAFESLASLSVGRSRETLLNDAELDENGQIRSVDFDGIREGNRKLTLAARRFSARIAGRLDLGKLHPETHLRYGGEAQLLGTHHVSRVRKNAPEVSLRGEGSATSSFTVVPKGNRSPVSTNTALGLISRV